MRVIVYEDTSATREALSILLGGTVDVDLVEMKAGFFFRPATSPHTMQSDAERLTPREQETLTFLVDGLSYKMIADRMGGISYETVRSFMKSIYRKLHVASMTEAVAKALKDGLV
ncbi:response regulator transcription factor [Fibrella sp. HMF5335]|uniref:Response regulator transcription factor n=1 Tax=Fibrella rubiginis TaxID=2817060 RepID=A0A939K3B4_9BACT|nr:LuxR C-terminal-related transcriptional regulator [Fibrella rubiginis]MBO0935468.1 response regulator transcription factor [Fibrella rubiginis]